jgi:hypothetical protein
VTLDDYLQQWAGSGRINPAQHATLSAISGRRRVSLYLELNALFYIGVLAIAGGIGWTIAVHAQRFGDLAILLALGGIFAACMYYCLRRAPQYSNERVEAAGMVDYVLYLGCLVFAVGLGYLQTRFSLFGEDWDHSLLAASVLFFALAYRFDNRFVLSLALTSLGGWFGVRLGNAGVRMADAMRLSAIAYGLVVASVGLTLYRKRLKQHFVDAYLHVATHAVMLALLAGVPGRDIQSLLSLLMLLAVAAALAMQGARYHRFVFVAYGVLYAYAGITVRVLRDIGSITGGLAYFIGSATMVVIGLVIMARRVARE